jgi:hypothetical protein
VNAFGKLLAHLFDHKSDPEAARRRQIYREWDRQRRQEMGPSDLAEIDAIFSRNL